MSNRVNIKLNPTEDKKVTDAILILDQFKPTSLIVNQQSTEQWSFDSGASNFMTPNLSDFQTIQMFEGESFVTANSVTNSKGIGTVLVNSFNGKQWINLELKNVHYIPSLPYLLFSEPACNPQISTDPKNGKLYLSFDGQVLFTGSRDPSDQITPYVMNLRVIKNQQKSANLVLYPSIMHHRLGHCPVNIIKESINRNLINDISLNNSSDKCDNCEVCLESKQKKTLNTGDLIKSTTPGDITHVDTYSPKIKSLNNLNTAFVFVDSNI